MSKPPPSRIRNVLGMTIGFSILAVPLIACIWWSVHTAKPMTREDTEQAALFLCVAAVLGVGVLIGRAK